MQVYMLSFFFSVSVYRPIEIRHLIFCRCQTLRFFLENVLHFLHFANFLRELAKVTKYLKALEIKMFDLSFWTKKFYRNIQNIR